MIQYVFFKNTPVRKINHSDPAETTIHDEIVALVKEMLQLKKGEAEAEKNFDPRRFEIQKRIEQVDAEIDQRVYRLYGLTEEEIRVVERK
jgi:tRNA A37 N6-isopentenylltransferase MiaA